MEFKRLGLLDSKLWRVTTIAKDSEEGSDGSCIVACTNTTSDISSNGSGGSSTVVVVVVFQANA